MHCQCHLRNSAHVTCGGEREREREQKNNINNNKNRVSGSILMFFQPHWVISRRNKQIHEARESRENQQLSQHPFVSSQNLLWKKKLPRLSSADENTHVIELYRSSIHLIELYRSSIHLIELYRSSIHVTELYRSSIHQTLREETLQGLYTASVFLCDLHLSDGPFKRGSHR